MIKAPLLIGTLAATFLVAGCSTPAKPSYPQPEERAVVLTPANSAFGPDYDYGQAPDELRNYEADAEGIYSGTESIEKKAVREAGRRLGATAGYNHQAEILYQEIEAYDPYLDKIFDFQSFLLPNGVVPPVIAQTDQVLSYDTGKSKTLRARVYKTIREARFANPRAPSWRDYLNLNLTGIEYPLPQLQQTIDKYRSVWEQAVQEGWEMGHQQARQAFEIAINELDRDYLGMQLFQMLWLAEMVEPPRIVDTTINVDGGGQGSDEMAVGVRRMVISEDAYFVNDSSQWNALIAEASDRLSDVRTGLNDVVSRQDNTDSIPESYLDTDLKRLDR